MSYRYADAVLIVFCKAPIPGQVKTRLLTELTSVQAMEIHIELTAKTLQLVIQSQLCPVQLWCMPSIDHPFFLTLIDYPISLWQQQGNDLGERMHQAFCSAFENYRHALLIGCDCPSLSQHDLTATLVALHQGNDVVLSPAEDGGYVLVGLNRPQPELFERVSWGSAQVLEQTLDRIRQSNLRCSLLNMQWDLDTPEDLARYRRLANEAMYVLS